jgi:hypothetical protein
VCKEHAALQEGVRWPPRQPLYPRNQRGVYRLAAKLRKWDSASWLQAEFDMCMVQQRLASRVQPTTLPLWSDPALRKEPTCATSLL